MKYVIQFTVIFILGSKSLFAVAGYSEGVVTYPLAHPGDVFMFSAAGSRWQTELPKTNAGDLGRKDKHVNGKIHASHSVNGLCPWQNNTC